MSSLLKGCLIKVDRAVRSRISESVCHDLFGESDNLRYVPGRTSNDIRIQYIEVAHILKETLFEFLSELRDDGVVLGVD